VIENPACARLFAASPKDAGVPYTQSAWPLHLDDVVDIV